MSPAAFQEHSCGLMEEVGELSTALREYDSSPVKHEELAAEFADVLAWLFTIANVVDVDLTKGNFEKIWFWMPRLPTTCLQLPGRRKTLTAIAHLEARQEKG